MVTLQSRWKTDRSWNVRRYVFLAGCAAIVAAILFTASFIPSLFRRLTAPGSLPPVAAGQIDRSSPAAVQSSPAVDPLDGRLGREFTVLDYTFGLPKDFQLDVLPQPADVPRGGRFTGLRFRGSHGDAAQLCIMVVDDPKMSATDVQVKSVEERLQDALEHFFDRLTANAAVVSLVRRKAELGETDQMPFIRIGFSGSFRDRRKARRVSRSGIALVTVAPGREVYFYSQWEATSGRDMYDTLAASLETLRRKGPAIKSSRKPAKDGEAALPIRGFIWAEQAAGSRCEILVSGLVWTPGNQIMDPAA